MIGRISLNVPRILVSFNGCFRFKGRHLKAMRKLIQLLTLIGLTLSFTLQAAEPTVLITGANRGIGLEYASQYKAKGFKVIGTARTPAEAKELKAMGVEVLPLDVTKPKSVEQLAKSLSGRAIDILINNAGYFDRQDTSIDKVDFNVLERTFSVNTLGPLRVTQALMENLRKGKMKKIINMSSVLGSIERSSGRWYAYRGSKTALNQFTRILSVELKSEGFIVVSVHPGWVQTDMGGENATYTVKESVTGLVKVIDNLKPADNGKFYAFNGEPIAW